MSKWADWPMLGFDLESTGVDAQNDRIVTTAARLEWGTTQFGWYSGDDGEVCPEDMTKMLANQ